MNIMIHKILAASLLSAGLLTAAFTSHGQERRDSVVYLQSVPVDSSLVGKDIFNLLAEHEKNGSGVTVHQSQRLRDAFESHVASNPYRTASGFRVRIFNDNRQTSRNDSEAALERFREMFPGVSAYRTYSNPFFRVTVGDFRTRSEAIRLLLQVKVTFPTAFIVQVEDRLHSYTIEKIETDNQE